MKQPSWQQITDQRTQKKDRDLDHAHAMGRDRTRVGGSTDALSSGARGKRRGFSLAAAAHPLDQTRVMRTVNRGEYHVWYLQRGVSYVKHMFNKTDTTCQQVNLGMAYLGASNIQGNVHVKHTWKQYNLDTTHICEFGRRSMHALAGAKSRTSQTDP